MRPAKEKLAPARYNLRHSAGGQDLRRRNCGHVEVGSFQFEQPEIGHRLPRSRCDSRNREGPRAVVATRTARVGPLFTPLVVATINHERMPVLLTREEEFESWLKGSPSEAMELAREYPPG